MAGNSVEFIKLIFKKKENSISSTLTMENLLGARGNVQTFRLDLILLFYIIISQLKGLLQSIGNYKNTVIYSSILILSMGMLFNDKCWMDYLIYQGFL